MAAIEGRTKLHVTQLVNCLGLGGTERQLVEHLRRLDRDERELDLCCLQKLGEFMPEVRSLGIEPHEFHLKGSLARPNTGVQVARLALRLRRQGTDLLHCHDFYSNLVGAAAARLAGLPYIISRRDLGAWVGPWRGQALRVVTRTARWVLCNSTAIRDHLVRVEGVDPSRIELVPNGLDVSRFDRELRAPLASSFPVAQDGQPVFVVVGNMKHEVKGHSHFMKAAALVARVRPDAMFVLVGDGALRTGLERQARNYGLSSRVHFVGKRTDVPAILGRCHVAVSPSHSEGFSNAVMEAMAARLPVVATAVGGNPELVRDGRTGFLVPRSEVQALAEAMTRLANDRTLSTTLGLAGRRRIEDEYSMDRVSAILTALYRRIADVPSERRRAA